MAVIRMKIQPRFIEVLFLVCFGVFGSSEKTNPGTLYALFSPKLV